MQAGCRRKGSSTESQGQWRTCRAAAAKRPCAVQAAACPAEAALAAPGSALTASRPAQPAVIVCLKGAGGRGIRIPYFTTLLCKAVADAELRCQIHTIRIASQKDKVPNSRCIFGERLPPMANAVSQRSFISKLQYPPNYWTHSANTDPKKRSGCMSSISAQTQSGRGRYH